MLSHMDYIIVIQHFIQFSEDHQEYAGNDSKNNTSLCSHLKPQGGSHITVRHRDRLSCLVKLSLIFPSFCPLPLQMDGFLKGNKWSNTHPPSCAQINL